MTLWFKILCSIRLRQRSVFWISRTFILVIVLSSKSVSASVYKILSSKSVDISFRCGNDGCPTSSVSENWSEIEMFRYSFVIDAVSVIRSKFRCKSLCCEYSDPFWDRPGVLDDKASVEAILNSAHHRASFLAASSQHSGDWLFALPIASCGLRLDDEAVRVALGLRLGLDLCIPHHCHCGSTVRRSWAP